MGEITWFALTIPRSKNENVGKVKETRKSRRDLPVGPMARNLPDKAGDGASITSLGSFMCHGQPSPCATTTELTRCNQWSPRALELGLRNKKCQRNAKRPVNPNYRTALTCRKSRKPVHSREAQRGQKERKKTKTDLLTLRGMLAGNYYHLCFSWCLKISFTESKKIKAKRHLSERRRQVTVEYLEDMLENFCTAVFQKQTNGFQRKYNIHMSNTLYQ